MKKCITCKEEKEASEFHKHKQMKDGRLGSCKSCTTKYSIEWRLRHLDCRKIEYAKTAKIKGTLNRADYLAKKSKEAKGRKYSLNMYAAKRRLQTENVNLSELDIFAYSEAIHLREMRNKCTNFKWNVDHIVPLHHKFASGLHVAQNLQVVPALWNFKKRNSNMDKFFPPF